MMIHKGVLHSTYKGFFMTCSLGKVISFCSLESVLDEKVFYWMFFLWQSSHFASLFGIITEQDLQTFVTKNLVDVHFMGMHCGRK